LRHETLTNIYLTDHIPASDSMRRLPQFAGGPLGSWGPTVNPILWGAFRKNIVSDRFSTKTAISAHI